MIASQLQSTVCRCGKTKLAMEPHCPSCERAPFSPSQNVPRRFSIPERFYDDARIAAAQRGINYDHSADEYEEWVERYAEESYRKEFSPLNVANTGAPFVKGSALLSELAKATATSSGDAFPQVGTGSTCGAVKSAGQER